MQAELINKVLTEAEQNYVTAFVENETQFSAVHKLATASLKDGRNKTVREIEHKFSKGEITNEEAGAQLRACAEGIRLVGTVFADLAQLKKQTLKESKVHPGR